MASLEQDVCRIVIVQMAFVRSLLVYVQVVVYLDGQEQAAKVSINSRQQVDLVTSLLVHVSY